mgnify:CR=1 FL=1
MRDLFGCVGTRDLGGAVDVLCAFVALIEGRSGGRRSLEDFGGLRQRAPVLAGLMVAGRIAASFAAEIGTMKVTEELDAVRTLGISPMALLVLPRTLALMIAVPLLTVYADVLGVFGGMLIASSQLNVSFTEFVSRFQEAVAVRHFLIGIGKAPFFAMLIALVGCYQGFQIRGGVDDVGRHTTRAKRQRGRA